MIGVAFGRGAVLEASVAHTYSLPSPYVMSVVVVGVVC